MLLILLLASQQVKATGAQTPHNLITVAVWEDSTPTSIAKARACLPKVLQDLYVPALMAATSASTNITETRLMGEQLILFHFYQRLSCAWDICKAFAQGMRMGEHYVYIYELELHTTPALFPRQSLVNGTATCLAAVAAMPNPIEREVVRNLFRHRFTDGVVCLRKYTVHGGVPTYIV